MNKRVTIVKKTTCNPQKVTKTKFSGDDKLNCFVSLSNFCRFTNPFAMIIVLSELVLCHSISVLLVAVIEEISCIDSSKSRLKTWRYNRIDLILSMRHTYINLNLNSLLRHSFRSKIIHVK